MSADDDDVVGDVVNVAARLQTAAGAGQVLVGEATFRLVRLGALLRAVPPLDLKGKAAPVNAFLLLSLDRDEDTAASPFVGRAGELERLLAVLDAGIARTAGPPGIDRGLTRSRQDAAGPRAGGRGRRPRPCRRGALRTGGRGDLRADRRRAPTSGVARR